jgi:hypothetical protein
VGAQRRAEERAAAWRGARAEERAAARPAREEQAASRPAGASAREAAATRQRSVRGRARGEGDEQTKKKIG